MWGTGTRRILALSEIEICFHFLPLHGTSGVDEDDGEDLDGLPARCHNDPQQHHYPHHFLPYHGSGGVDEDDGGDLHGEVNGPKYGALHPHMKNQVGVPVGSHNLSQ